MNKTMKFIALLFLCILPLIVSCGGGDEGGGGGDEQPAPTVNVTGTWSGTLSTSLLPETPVTFNLTQTAASGVIVSITSVEGITKQEVVRASSANVTGTYILDDVAGTSGSVSGTVSGNTIGGFAMHKSTGCPGTFNGTATVNGDTMTFTFTGSDCYGTHANGHGTATKATQGGLVISTGKFLGPGLTEVDVKDNKITFVQIVDMPGTCSGIKTTSIEIDPNNGTPIMNSQFTEQWHNPETVSYSSFDMTVNGTFSDNDHVSGTWNYSDADNCQMSGSWSATRTASDQGGYFPVTSWGGNGTTNGKFGELRGIDIDSQGNIWAADLQNETIQKFDTSGNYLTKFISNIETGATYDGPTHIAFGNDNYLYALSTNGSWMARYDTTGNQEYLGSVSYGLASILDFAVDARNGDIYVVFVGLLAKVSNGSIVWSKEFANINSVAVDQSGNVYVTAYPGIQKYDPDGNFITECENIDVAGVSRGLLSFDSLNRLYFLPTSLGHYIKIFDASLNLISSYNIIIETGDYYYQFGSFAVEGDGQYVYITHTWGNNKNKILKYKRE